MTAAADDLTEGFRVLLEQHGETWVFGAAEFSAVLEGPTPENAAMAGDDPRAETLTALTVDLPSPGPVRGSELSIDAVAYRVTADPDVSGPFTRLRLTRT